MSIKGFVGVMGSSLQFGESGKWQATIRRINDRIENSFPDYHNKEITPSIVKQYIPNWQNFAWNEIKDSILLGKSESFANDKNFKINISGSEKTNFSHEDIKNMFFEFMLKG